MQCFAIRHKPSGGLLSLPIGRGGKGGTWTEPTPLDGPWPIRLFHTEHAAKISLTYWLNGRISVSTNVWDETDPMENYHVELMPERKRANMEIVPMTLIPTEDLGSGA